MNYVPGLSLANPTGLGKVTQHREEGNRAGKTGIEIFSLLPTGSVSLDKKTHSQSKPKKEVDIDFPFTGLKKKKKTKIK